ncbi:PREDICTED: fatty acyl-CoA reductase 1-like [Vollenhovia emeryi]|uniref:fatty acyl-CoA reductase 1-like n=1 Tax=Vollenhovia emeryi TaxID=411798 RepID=UPI0005F41DDC|nr:PREDICTED: fatty acyl-CoA reductase 1-like [Vollenhovia emeryi]
MSTQTDESQVKKMESEIAQFFSGRKVLITVGLGCLGKLLIEKLLRCCPNIATLYVFVREKDGKNPRERIQQLPELPLFEKLKEEQPHFLQKLIMIESDLSKPNLGLSQQNRNRLLDTNVIFHGAMMTRLNQKFRIMVNVNVQATKDILLLARNMPDLKAFVHLSTTFAHSPIKSIEEKHYPPPIKTDELLSLLNILNDRKLDALTSSLIDGWPNSFTFTKAVAEDTVLRYGNGMPVCIVRPSNVTSTWNEPIMCWSDSVYGPIGLLVSSSLGLLRTIRSHVKKNLDFVPADYVTSCLIATAWHINARHTKGEFKVNAETGVVSVAERVLVYNYVSSCQKPMTWDTFKKHVRTHGSNIPGVEKMRLRYIVWNSRLWVHKIFMFLMHLLSATIVDDSASLLSGYPPRWYRAYNLISTYFVAMYHSISQQWYFRNDAVVELWGRMNAVDREIFKFDMSNFDWSEYVKRMTYNMRDFVNNDSLDGVKERVTDYIELRFYT